MALVTTYWNTSRATVRNTYKGTVSLPNLVSTSRATAFNRSTSHSTTTTYNTSWNVSTAFNTAWNTTKAYSKNTSKATYNNLDYCLEYD